MVKLSTFVKPVLFLLLTSRKSATAPVTDCGPSSGVSVTLGGQTYVNKGLVGFGLIPHDFKDSTGDTLGGVGSSIALKKWKKDSKDTFKGTLIVQPDRGFNVDHTVDYQARQHEVDIEFTPYYGTTNLDFAAAQKTLKLKYKKTLLYTDQNRVATSGLDPLGVLNGNPALPIAKKDYKHLSLDSEGLVLLDDGSFWVSDEYGPYIYHFSKNGQLKKAIQPPNAILPRDSKGALNFTGDSNPTTGRSPNQGFEGLTFNPSTNTLYALLQSAAWQDGGSDKSTSRFTRLLAWDVSKDNDKQPPLVGEWVVPLPQSSKGNTLGANEILYLKKGVFLILARDGDGRGGDDSNSKYKQADLIDINGATDIHGTKFDDPTHPIATGGTLDQKITPAKYVSFVNYLDSTQLARFGLHNGKPNDPTLLCAKWESLALAPVCDPKNKDDYFLFTGADNDFITTRGVSVGQPYNAGLDNDNQFLVYRVTLPGAKIKQDC